MQRKCGILCLRKSSVNIGYDVLCSVMSDSVTPWTIARQAPLSMGFPRQEYWSGLPFPSPGALPDPRAEPTSSALAGGFFITAPPGNIGCNYYRSLLSLWWWNPQLFLLLSCRFSVVALKFYREALWTSNLAEKCSVRLGLKPCLHSKLIPSSLLDCVLGHRGRTKGDDSGDGHWSFSTTLLGMSLLVKDLGLLTLTFWIAYSHHFFLSRSSCWLHLLRSLDFLNSLACCPFQVSRSQPRPPLPQYFSLPPLSLFTLSSHWGDWLADSWEHGHLLRSSECRLPSVWNVLSLLNCPANFLSLNTQLWVNCGDFPSLEWGCLRKQSLQDFPGGPVVKRIHLPRQGTWVQSLVRELRSYMLQGN